MLKCIFYMIFENVNKICIKNFTSYQYCQILCELWWLIFTRTESENWIAELTKIYHYNTQKNKKWLHTKCLKMSSFVKSKLIFVTLKKYKISQKTQYCFFDKLYDSVQKSSTKWNFNIIFWNMSDKVKFNIKKSFEKNFHRSSSLIYDKFNIKLKVKL